MNLFELTLIAAAFLSSVVAGLILSFATVIMPGLRNLDDGDFLRAFRAIDRVIQNGQPLFVLVWAGSLVSLLAATVMGLSRLDDPWGPIVAAAAVVNLLGVHLPTLVVNVPLNNRVQALRLEGLSPEELRSARMGFEGRWNRWNVFRAVVASVVAVALIAALWAH